MSDLCPVTVAQDSVENEYQPETAGESHLLLLRQKKNCDVTFTFPNLPDRIVAHEIFLGARSTVLAKIFRIRESENVQGREIEISESTPEIFQQFLEFIYADKLEVDIAGALELMQLSHKYKVHPLTKKCEELLKTEIPIADSVKVFQTARRCGRRELMDRAGSIMVESFLKLARADSLANAEEETLVYLLECDDLAVQEVELFQVIRDWGKKQVGASADVALLKNKLKNLIWKIMYANMAPDEFTKVVVPTGLLSVEETASVYSCLCGDEVTRRNSKTQFDTTRRQPVTKMVDLYEDVKHGLKRFPAFTKHSISFSVDRTHIYGKVRPLRKTFITEIKCFWPVPNLKYRQPHVLNFDVSVVEYSGPAKEGNFTIRFQKKLMNCDLYGWGLVSVEPPVELVSGRTYSVNVEDHSTSAWIDCFRKDPEAYDAIRFFEINRDANVDFIDVRLMTLDRLTLRDVHRKTDFCLQNLPKWCGDLSVIRFIEVGLM